jgi:hypothetical protein
MKSAHFIYYVGMAGLFLGPVLILKWAEDAGLVADPGHVWATRLFGVAIGLMVACYGNIIPKYVMGTIDDPAQAARCQTAQRHAAWIFVLGGLANAAIWLLAPIGSAPAWSVVPIVLAIILVIGRLAAAKRPRAT